MKKQHRVNLRRATAKLRMRRFPLGLIVIVMVVFLALIFTLRYLGERLKNSDYFRIKEVLMNNAGQSEEFLYFRGRNIFDIDLIKESREILKFYPMYKKIKLMRILPNRLFVEFVKRQPIGIIELYRYFYVDEDAALFDMPGKIDEQDLPLIAGLETKIFGPQAGKEYNIAELTLAVKIIKEFNANKRLKDYKLKTVDVGKLAHTFLVMPAGWEVKIGQDYTRQRLDILSRLLMRLKKEQGNIEYIDLRFKEPVIKFKDKQR